MSRRRLQFRVGALLAGGALGLHELRYVLAYGGDAPAVLDHHGHAYLAVVAPCVGVVIALAVASLLVRVARSPGMAGAEPRVRLLWPAASATLLLVYGGQELAEGALAAGHPDGIAGILGHGGWVAIPVALAIGGVVAVTVRGAAAAEGRAPTLALPLPRADRSPPSPRPSGRTPTFPADVLARHLAGRAPPALSA